MVSVLLNKIFKYSYNELNTLKKLEMSRGSISEKNIISGKVNKQLKDYLCITLNPHLKVFYLFNWAHILLGWIFLQPRTFWFPFWGCRGCLKFRGHSRSPEEIRGQGQIWHPETRGSHLSIIYGGLGGKNMSKSLIMGGL